MIALERVQDRLAAIEKEIREACNRSGRNREDITIVAVTKEVSVNRTEEVLDTGLLHLGENRPEGFIRKHEAIHREAVWHFIGNLQSRKVKEIINEIDYVHSIDRMSIVKEIQKRAEQPVRCFVQVNVSGEESKSGVSPEELEKFINDIQAFDKIIVVGLMTMAPFIEDMEKVRSYFRQLAQLRDHIASQQLSYAPCTQLSMGMSNDYVVAIEEGATFIRIGTALVGKESEGDE